MTAAIETSRQLPAWPLPVLMPQRLSLSVVALSVGIAAAVSTIESGEVAMTCAILATERARMPVVRPMLREVMMAAAIVAVERTAMASVGETMRHILREAVAPAGAGVTARARRSIRMSVRMGTAAVPADARGSTVMSSRTA